MTIIKNEKYSLSTIGKLTDNGFEDQPVEYGLAIEKKCCDSNSWYVMMFIKYDAKERDCQIENIGSRILDIEECEWDMVRGLIKCGREIVSWANLEA